MLDKKLLNSYAKLLIEYSLKVKKNEQIGIYGTIEASPLIEQLYIELLKLGAYPFPRIALNNQSELLFKYGSEEQLMYLPEITVFETKKLSGEINLLSSPNTKSLTNVDAGRQASFRKARKPLSDIVLKKDRWILALYPTDGYAQDAEMSLSEFEDFVADAVKIKFKNPIAEWRKVENYQNKIVARLKNSDSVRILGERTDLTLSVKNRKFINSCGVYNMPSGEVFTSPIENSAEGHIYYEFPACTSGNEVSGVYLEFKNGKVIKATAEKNETFLIKMLEIDKGAKFLGEFAFGLNYGIQKFTKNILFDEKIGGTIHLALGNSYPETGGQNKSALHWDMIKDLRSIGEVRINGKTVLKKGRFIF